MKEFDGKTGVIKVNLGGAGDSLNKEEQWIILERLTAIQRQLDSIVARMDARWPQEAKKKTKKESKNETNRRRNKKARKSSN